MRAAVVAYLLLLVIYTAEGLTHGQPPKESKHLPKASPGMVLRLVSVNDSYTEGPNPPPLIQYRGKGKFNNSEGNLAFSDLKGLLRQTEEDKKEERPAYLLIDVRKGTPLDELVEMLNRLREATPPETSAVVFIRVEGLERFPPKNK